MDSGEEECHSQESYSEDEELKEVRKKRTLVKLSIKIKKRTRTEDPVEDDEAPALPRGPQVKNCWRTPRIVVAWLQTSPVLRGTFIGDACASAENALFPYYYTEETDAMQNAWHRAENASVRGVREPVVLCHQTSTNPSLWFINPPYGKDRRGRTIRDWLRKCALEASKGVGVVALVPCPNGEKHGWRHVIGKASTVFIIESGRLSYGDPVTGREDRPARFGSVIIYWDPRELCTSEECRHGKDNLRREREGRPCRVVTDVRPLYF